MKLIIEIIPSEYGYLLSDEVSSVREEAEKISEFLNSQTPIIIESVESPDPVVCLRDLRKGIEILPWVVRLEIEKTINHLVVEE